MLSRRAVLAGTGLAVLGVLALAAGLAAAQGELQGAPVHGQGDGFGNPQSPIQRGINDLYYLILPLSLIVGILVEALLLYAMVRYRGKPGRVQATEEHERGHTKLEIAWTIPPAVILLIVGLLSTQTLGAIENPPTPDFTVDVIASQFSFGFRGPGDAPGGALASTLRVEEGRVVLLNVTSRDVIHSFAIHSFGVKIDAVPGRLNTYWLQADAPGSFQVQCMEYCGVGHAYMRTGVEVVPRGTCPPVGYCSAAGAENLSLASRVLDIHFPERGGPGGPRPWSANPPTIQASGTETLGVRFSNPPPNTGTHNFTMVQGTNGPVVAKIDAQVPAGDTTVAVLVNKDAEGDPRPLGAGTYTYYCAIPGHRGLGMEGTLTVA